jgi:transglutaminase-like putative cysteine protease
MNHLVHALLLSMLLAGFRPAGLAVDNEPSMDWGHIPMEYLSMSSFPGDSNATVVVLFDLGKVTFDDNYDILFTRHTRVKILNKGGFDWATQNIPYYASQGTQRVKGIEAQTVRLEANGQTVVQEMEDKSVFDEETGEGYRTVRFTLPAITEGCVIEWKYTVVSTNPLFFPHWDFQTDEPELWSEFIYKTPGVFNYAAVRQGYERFYISDVTDAREAFITGGTPRMVRIRTTRLVAKDVPALRDEPYITTLDDYRTRVWFQLVSYTWPGELPRRFLESWEKLAESFLENEHLGGKLGGSGLIRTQAKLATKGLDDPLQKLEAVHAYVRNTVKWNERRRFFADDDLDDVLEAKTGNSAEVNLLLTSMLREAGIQADPVLLSTRANGKLQTSYPIYEQFDYLVCRAEIGGKEYLIDATDRYRPFTLLPRRALNSPGLLVRKGPATWVNIIHPGFSKKNITATATIHGEGTLTGNVRMEFQDHSAADERSNLSSSKEVDYLKGLFQTETSGLTLDATSIMNRDSTALPLIVSAGIASSTYVQALGDFLYINPHVVDRLTENPFKLPTRTFPIDFGTGNEATYTFEMPIPEGYDLKEYPRDTYTALPMRGGTYTRKAAVQGNTFRMTTTFKRDQTLYEPKHYNSVRLFYQQIVAAESEHLVLQKKGSSDSKATNSKAKD